MRTVLEDDVATGILIIDVEEGPRTDLKDVVFIGAEDLLPENFVDRLEFRVGTPAPVDLNVLGTDLYRIRNFF